MGSMNENKGKKEIDKRRSKAKYQERNGFSRDVSDLEWQLERGKKIHGVNRKNQISINHLLDFQGYENSAEYMDRRQKEKQRERLDSHKVKKQRHYENEKVHLSGMSFINVNYKFVVDYRNEYQIQKYDPNASVSLKDILSIIVPKGNACPICLSEDLTAPRMIVSCGHIICLKCLLSLLDSEIPFFKKRESKAIVEKYKECPLCFSIIRTNEIKPVVIDNIDERFEIPKMGDQTVLNLMIRPQSGFIAFPRTLTEREPIIDDYPDVNRISELKEYSRIFKGNFDYLKTIYISEIEKLQHQKHEESVLYGDEEKYFDLAIDHINKDIKLCKVDFEKPETRTREDTKPRWTDFSNSFYFYETGFNAPSTYVLSPLDMKILKLSYGNDYKNLPSSIVVKIENIRYEELCESDSLSKYKYLSHLPFGTSIGFMECDWKGSDYISNEAWKLYRIDLQKRSKASMRRTRMEDMKKQRAISEEELKTREFFDRENNGNDPDTFYDNTADYVGGMGSLTIIDNRELPQLSKGRKLSSTEENDRKGFQDTVWGTRIPKHNESEAAEDESYKNELMKRLNEHKEMNKSSNKSKGKKKKMVLVSSNTSW